MLYTTRYLGVDSRDYFTLLWCACACACTCGLPDTSGIPILPLLKYDGNLKHLNYYLMQEAGLRRPLTAIHRIGPKPINLNRYQTIPSSSCPLRPGTILLRYEMKSTEYGVRSSRVLSTLFL